MNTSVRLDQHSMHNFFHDLRDSKKSVVCFELDVGWKNFCAFSAIPAEPHSKRCRLPNLIDGSEYL